VGLLARRSDADVAREHRVGGCEHCPEDQRRAEREAHRLGGEQRHEPDRGGHHQRDQDGDRAPLPKPEAPLDLQARREHRHQQGELGDPADQLRVCDRVEAPAAEQMQAQTGGDPQPQVDHAGGECALVLVGEGADRRAEGHPEEQQPDRVGIADGEARLGCDGGDIGRRG